MLLPLVVMLVVWTLVPRSGASITLASAARAVVLASAANSVVAWLSTVIPLNALLRPFWNAEEAAFTVAEAAQTMGRYAGVFGQPAEAGLMYSVAAVLAAWRYSERSGRMYLLLALITVGGILSVSKVFLLVGLPVTIALLLVRTRGARSLTTLTTIAAVIFIGVSLFTANFLRAWDGFGYLTRLFNPPQGVSLIEFYTAGRWNSDAMMIQRVSTLLAASPLTGVGAAGLAIAYDSQWTSSLVMSGVLGMLGVIVTLLVITRHLLRIPDRETRLMGLAFLAVLLGASFGIPSLTANRVATVVWLIAALLMSIAHSEDRKNRISPLTPRPSKARARDCSFSSMSRCSSSGWRATPSSGSIRLEEV